MGGGCKLRAGTAADEATEWTLSEEALSVASRLQSWWRRCCCSSSCARRASRVDASDWYMPSICMSMSWITSRVVLARWPLRCGTCWLMSVNAELVFGPVWWDIRAGRRWTCAARCLCSSSWDCCIPRRMWNGILAGGDVETCPESGFRGGERRCIFCRMIRESELQKKDQHQSIRASRGVYNFIFWARARGSSSSPNRPPPCRTATSWSPVSSPSRPITLSPVWARRTALSGLMFICAEMADSS